MLIFFQHVTREIIINLNKKNIIDRYVLNTQDCIPLVLGWIEKDNEWRSLASKSSTFVTNLSKHVLSTFSVQGANALCLISTSIENQDVATTLQDTVSKCLKKSRHRKNVNMFRRYLTQTMFQLNCTSLTKITINELMSCVLHEKDQDTKSNASATLSNAILRDRTIVKHIENETSRLFDMMMCDGEEIRYLDVLLTKCASYSEISAKQIASKLDVLVEYIIRKRKKSIISLLAHAIQHVKEISSLHTAVDFVSSLVSTKEKSTTCGNAIQILIHYASHKDGCALLEKQQDKKNMIPRLVDVLKSSKHHRSTRKNAAVLLAKFARSPSLMKKIRQVRGMEIIMTLSRDGFI